MDAEKRGSDGERMARVTRQPTAGIEPPPYQAVDNAGSSGYAGMPTGYAGMQTVSATGTMPSLPPMNVIVYEPASREMTCPKCHATGMSIFKREIGLNTHLLAFSMFMMVICIPCFWVPYVMDKFKECNHYCSSCGELMGKETTLHIHTTATV